MTLPLVTSVWLVTAILHSRLEFTDFELEDRANKPSIRRSATGRADSPFVEIRIHGLVVERPPSKSDAYFAG